MSQQAAKVQADAMQTGQNIYSDTRDHVLQLAQGVEHQLSVRHHHMIVNPGLADNLSRADAAVEAAQKQVQDMKNVHWQLVTIASKLRELGESRSDEYVERLRREHVDRGSFRNQNARQIRRYHPYANQRSRRQI